MSKINPNLAYVLTGGGAKGCYQLGAMKALDEAGIAPQAIYGTSVGAINSWGYRYLGLKKLEELWFDIRSRKDILEFNWGAMFLSAKGIYNLKPMKKTMQKHSDGSVVNNIDSVVTRVSLATGELQYCSSRYFSSDEFIDCVVSSSSIPGIMDPHQGEWVDGGVRDMAPIGKAIQDGYKQIIVIETNPREVPKYKIGNFLSNAYRAIDELLEHEVLMDDLSYCKMKHPKHSIMSIYPDKLVIDTLEFNKDKIMAGYAYGYACAKKLLEQGSM